MAAIKREPTPPGPIADLFVRLDDLHSRAGRPSTREVANRVGRGNISSSTVHNIFRSSRVPRWPFLEQIIYALGGSQQDRDEFHTLWEAAWRAENTAAVLPEAKPEAMSPQLVQTGFAVAAKDWSSTAPRPAQRIWSNEIPPRNLNFTGRAGELERLHDNLHGPRSPRVQVISGMGGIGKTEIATEYIHRNIEEYEIVWWVRAEHHDRVRDALVKLGQRLEIRQATMDSDRDRTIAAVIETLQSEARSSWLLVYDNVVNPFDLQRYLPASRPGGHIIITSRQLNWPSKPDADGVELPPFTQAEAISFLRRKVPGLALAGERKPPTEKEDARRADEAGRLAAELDCLPIAIDHAAAYLAETAQSVDEYLTRFAKNAHQLLSEHPGDSEFPASVSGTWAMSTTLLTPDAEHLFNLCAFFSPEPIAASFFLHGPEGIDSPPGVTALLSSPQRFRAAANQLHRLSLARVDGARDLIHVHRVVQAVTQGRLRQDRVDMFHAYREAVDTLLARSNPGNPDHASNDVTYDLSLQHLEADHRFLRSPSAELRDLIIDQVRRLHLRGAHVEAVQFGQHALLEWQERFGDDDLRVLAMAVEVTIAMYMGGRVADAHDLILRTRPTLQRYTDDDGLKVFLLSETIYAADLRARSQFREALELDLGILPKSESVFGELHERTLNVRNNIAVDYRHLGLFGAALEIDRHVFDGRSRILGPNDLLTLLSHNAVARDLRGLGFYQESLDEARRVHTAFEAADGRENLSWLRASTGFAVALRKAGHHWDALQESEHVLQRCHDYLGRDHPYTLVTATNLINDRRAGGDLASAEKLARETRDICQQSGAPDDLLYATLLNLASVLRAAGRPEAAMPCDEQARRGLIRIYGDTHPFTLAANINYAADLAGCGKLGEAIQVGRETLARCRQWLGADHPDALMAAANLAIDEAAVGDQVTARQRLAEVRQRYEQTLTLEHPEARAAAQGIRLTADIEPLVL